MRKKRIPNFYYVYIITNTLNNKQYVGSRVCYDKDPLTDGYLGSSIFLSNEIEKEGKEKFVKKILKFYTSKEKMSNGEIKNILKHNTLYPNGYNRFLPPNKFNTIGISIKEIWIAKYGEKIAEKKYKEWKRKESKSNSGKNNPFYNKNHSNETKNKIRLTQTGKTYSIETNKKKGGNIFGNKNGMFGRVWITNLELNDNKIILNKELQNYLKNGWTKGRKKYKVQRT